MQRLDDPNYRKEFLREIKDENKYLELKIEEVGEKQQFMADMMCSSIEMLALLQAGNDKEVTTPNYGFLQQVKAPEE